MKILAASLLALVATNSFAECYEVSGVIKSEPALYAGELDPYGCAFSYPIELDSNVCITGETGFYLQINGSGNATFKGTSELTTVPVTSEGDLPIPTLAYTPLAYPPEDPFDQLPDDDTRQDLQNFTSQAILKTRFRGWRGHLYSKDSGVITRLDTPAGGFAGQIVRIVGGDGDFEGATGMIGVAGQEVGGEEGSAATYTGYFCVPE